MTFRKSLIATAMLASTMLTGCLTVIETGEVGVRVNMSREIQGAELVPGSWNQTIIGSVLTFPVKDINVTLNDMTPMTAENTALSDFDVSIVYGISPSAVAELYSTKSRSFHAYNDKTSDTYLMYNYVVTLAKNAAYKSVRQFKNLDVADNRVKIEEEIRDGVNTALKAEGLDTAVTLTVVQIRNIKPNDALLNSATDLVKSQNEIKIKENEVRLAKLESERMQALAQNSTQSIAYMQAQAQLTIAQAVKEGKVQTILLPHNMNMLSLPNKWPVKYYENANSSSTI